MHKKIILRTDGGARGNPGPAAYGFVIEDENGHVIKESGQYLGEKTNNEAEYLGLIAGLEEVKKLKAEDVKCFLDSELVVKQLNREYRVKDKNLASLFVKVWNLSQSFKQISYHHVMRGQNKRADWLLNQILDQH
ncbi:MAG: ribonuclease HI family protein [Patescibacteria group bacterium]